MVVSIQQNSKHNIRQRKHKHTKQGKRTYRYITKYQTKKTNIQHKVTEHTQQNIRQNKHTYDKQHPVTLISRLIVFIIFSHNQLNPSSMSQHNMIQRRQYISWCLIAVECNTDTQSVNHIHTNVKDARILRIVY